jgi:hypothetical protein
MKPNDPFMLGTEIVVGLTFVGALIVLGVAYYFLR